MRYSNEDSDVDDGGGDDDDSDSDNDDDVNENVKLVYCKLRSRETRTNEHWVSMYIEYTYEYISACTVEAQCSM